METIYPNEPLVLFFNLVQVGFTLFLVNHSHFPSFSDDINGYLNVNR